MSDEEDEAKKKKAEEDYRKAVAAEREQRIKERARDNGKGH